MQTTGPRIYNEISEQERLQKVQNKKKQALNKARRQRRNRILVIFGLLIGFLIVQISMTNFRTSQINADVKQSKLELEKAEVQNKELKSNVKLLNDDTYVGKLIRYKYYYTKPGEQVYNLPDSSADMSQTNGK